jgi:RNA polymerase sigma factor (sigma-70 family)
MYKDAQRGKSASADIFRSKTVYDLPEPSRTLLLQAIDTSGGAGFGALKPQRSSTGLGFSFPTRPGRHSSNCNAPTRRDRGCGISRRDDQPAAYRELAAATDAKHAASRSGRSRKSNNHLVEDHLYLVSFLTGKFLRSNFEASRGDRAEVSEAFQAVAREALVRAANAFDPGRGPAFYKYAWSAIWRALLNEQKARAKWERVTKGEPDESSLPPELIEVESESPSFPSLACLNVRQRQVIEARFLQNRNQRDVAAELGCTPQNVGIIERRALELLRESAA